MFGSFLPSLWSSINHSLLGSRSRHCYAIILLLVFHFSGNRFLQRGEPRLKLPLRLDKAKMSAGLFSPSLRRSGSAPSFPPQSRCPIRPLDLSWKIAVNRYPVKAGHAQKGRYWERYVNSCENCDPLTTWTRPSSAMPQRGARANYPACQVRTHEKPAFPRVETSPAGLLSGRTPSASDKETLPWVTLVSCLSPAQFSA